MSHTHFLPRLPNTMKIVCSVKVRSEADGESKYNPDNSNGNLKQNVNDLKWRNGEWISRRI